MTRDQLDVSLEDLDLLDEVELTTNLIIAASQSPGPISAREVDRLLGVETPPASTAPRVPQQTSR
jgi:hypothetical protein